MLRSWRPKPIFVEADPNVHLLRKWHQQLKFFQKKQKLFGTFVRNSKVMQISTAAQLQGDDDRKGGNGNVVIVGFSATDLRHERHLDYERKIMILEEQGKRKQTLTRFST